MGGRGAGSSGGVTGGLDPNNIVSTRSLISERSGSQTEVDETLTAFRNVHDEYGVVVDEIQVAVLKGKGANTMAYYDGSNIAINQSYFNSKKMDAAYDSCVKSGFHPGRGNKSGLEAVAAHELGHALNDKIASKMGKKGLGGLDSAANDIVKQAVKKTGSKNVADLRGKVSGYAKQSNAETVAEAFADVYCNGSKASSASIAIVEIMDSYLK